MNAAIVSKRKLPIGPALGRTFLASRSDRFAIALFVVFAAAALTYHVVFQIGEFDDLNRPFAGWTATRVFLPDSDLYEHVYDSSEITPVQVFSDMLHGHDPNIYVISAVAQALRSAGVDPLWFNLVLIAATTLFIIRLARQLECDPRSALVLVLLNPMTIYYVQTITKEIVELFLTTALFLMHGSKRGWFRTLSIGLIVLAATALRVQIAIPFAVILIGLEVRIGSSRTRFLIYFLGLTLLLPLAYRTGILDTTVVAEYREVAQSVTGLATYIDDALRNVPLSGIVLLPIRAFQTATEPFPSTTFADPDPHSINTYFFVLLGGLLIFSRDVVEIMGACVSYVRNRLAVPERVRGLMFAILVFWSFVSTNPFVHGRYMYNIIPLFPLVNSAIRSWRMRDGVADSIGRRRIIPWLAWARAGYVLFAGTYLILICRSNFFA